MCSSLSVLGGAGPASRGHAVAPRAVRAWREGAPAQGSLVAARLEAGFSWVVSVAQALCIVGVVWVGIWLIDRNTSTVGDVMVI